MAKGKLITISLNKSSDIRKALMQLYSYQKELQIKTELFANKLAELGIGIAKQNGGYYGDQIIFFTTDDSSGDDICLILNAQNKGLIRSGWYHREGGKNKIVYNTISPVLMAEFGAGWLADVSMYEVSVPGGRGTNSMFGHGDDDNWYWTDPTGETHQARDEEFVREMTPTHPMYKAVCEMRDNITKVAREVFG